MLGTRKKNLPKVQYHLVGFLYSYFFYLLKKNVDTYLINQLGRKTFPLIDDDADTDPESENFQPGFKAEPKEDSLESLLSAEDIDEAWVVGENNCAPFDKLTIQERQLIKWRYVDGKRSSEISLKINEHPNPVREHLKEIKEKLILIIQSDEDLMPMINQFKSIKKNKKG